MAKSRPLVRLLVGAFALLLLFFGSVSPALADVSMTPEPNEANLVLVVRFSDQTDRDSYNSTVVGSKSSWQSTMEAFNTDFKNYIGTVSRGKLNVKSLFPQDNNGTLEYLDLDISSAYFESLDNDLYLRDGVILKAAAEAFNTKYPNWDASQANLDDRPAYIDNVMVLVDTDLDATTGLRSNSNSLAEGYKIGNLPTLNVQVIHASRAGANLGGAIDAVPAHEYLHRLGAKDLYRNGGTGVGGELCDGWDMMATARRSLLPLAQTASDMGFLDIPTVASGAGAYEFELGTYLSDDGAKPHAVIVKSPRNTSEYFVLEYRRGDLLAIGGYEADRYLGGKLSYDHSGAYDGVVISRVNTSVSEKSNGKDDYLYVFRPGDSATSSLGGDGKVGTCGNAALKAGASFGSVAISDGIEQNALCYTDGTNSRTVVTVESADATSAKVKVEIPDYSDESPWRVVRGTDGADSFAAGNSVSGLSLALVGDRLWGIASAFTNGSSVICFDGTAWSVVPGAGDGVLDASVCEHGGNVVVTGISNDWKSAVVRICDGSSWIEKHMDAGATLNGAKAFSHDGHLYLTVWSSDCVWVYNVDSDPVLVGSQIGADYVADVCLVDATHLMISDSGSFWPKTEGALKTYELRAGSWVLSASDSYVARKLSTAKVGSKELLYAESQDSNVVGRLYEVEEGSLKQIACDAVSGGDSVRLCSDGTSFYLVDASGTAAGFNVTVFSSVDGTSWKQLGDAVKGVGEVSGVAFLGGKAYLLTSSFGGDGSVSLREHEPAPAAGFYEVSDFKPSDDASIWTAPTRYGYAFAGWYADESCSQPYLAASGRAYARFVPVSSLVVGNGPSLLKDDKAASGYDSTYLRFSYEFRVPSDSRRLDMGWDWSASWLGRTGTLKNPKYWLRSDNALLSNIVARVERTNFGSSLLVTGWISYETPDGTLVTAREASARQGTVLSAASGILAGGAATDGDRAYARGVLGDAEVEMPSAAAADSTVSLLDVSAYKSSSDPAKWLAPQMDGYAFAGWYADESCIETYRATTGRAYARFVPTSALVVGEGPSLCKDPKAGDGYDSTVMRFSYEFSVPSGSQRQSAGWDWTAEWSKDGGTALASKYWLRSDDALLANATARVEKANYGATLSLCGWVSYVTPDGTTVTAREDQPRQGSVESAAMGICSGGAASDGDRAYARGILEQI